MQCEKPVFNHPLRYDEAHFVERYLSSSYSLSEEEEGYEACIRRVREIFQRFNEDGIVTVQNQAICYA